MSCEGCEITQKILKSPVLRFTHDRPDAHHRGRSGCSHAARTSAQQRLLKRTGGIVGRKWLPGKSCMASSSRRRHVGGRGPANTKAPGPVRDRGPVPEPARRAQEPGLAPIGAAAQHTGVSVVRPLRIGYIPGIVRMGIPIPAPFPHIAVHVVQTPGRRLFLGHRVC